MKLYTMKKIKKFAIILIFTLNFFALPVVFGLSATSYDAGIIGFIETDPIWHGSEIEVSGDGNLLFLEEEGFFGYDNVSIYTIPDTYSGSITPNWKKDLDGEYLHISDDGSRIAYADNTNNIFYYGMASSEAPLYDFSVSDADIVVMSDNGEHVGYNYEDVALAKHLRFVSGDTPNVHWDEEIPDLLKFVVSNDGKVVCHLANDTVLAYDSTGLIWSINDDGSEIDSVLDIAMSNNGDNIVMEVNNDSANQVFVYDGEGSFLNNVSYDISIDQISATDSAIYISTLEISNPSQNRVYRYNTDLSEQIWEMAPLKAVSTMIPADDDNVVLLELNNNHLLAIDGNNGDLIFDEAPESSIVDLALSNNGSRAALLTLDDEIILYSIDIISNNGQPGFLDDFLGTFTSLGGIAALIASAALVFAISAMIFRKRE